MRALPINKTARPGGRPRGSRAPRSAFADWLAKGKINCVDLAKKLGISASSLYNLRNAYYSPGLALAVKIADISKDAVPVDSWGEVKTRPRGKHVE